MNRKIDLLVDDDKYSITLKENFAEFLNIELKREFGSDTNITKSDLLQAYIKELSSRFNIDNQISKTINRIDSINKIILEETDE